jgi:hypothetical protein
MSDREDPTPPFRDPIELAEELFGPKTAALMRKLQRAAKPTRIEVDPVTGQRSYSHEDD